MLKLHIYLVDKTVYSGFCLGRFSVYSEFCLGRFSVYSGFCLGRFSVYSGFCLDRFSVYSGFCLDRFSVYSGFCLDKLHCNCTKTIIATDKQRQHHIIIVPYDKLLVFLYC